jgi:hypothetical protein
MIRRCLVALAAALLAACGSSGAGAVADPVSSSAVDPGNAGGNKFLTVMTRNLYVGGDLFLPFVSDDPILAASTVWGDILASEPAKRMAAIADEIRAARPDLVGLEEAYHFTVTPIGTTTPVLLDLDYLTFLQDALSDAGRPRLRVVAVQPQTTLTIPFPSQGVQITLVDRDAILADVDVNVRSTGGGTFDAGFTTTLAGVIPYRQKRGWVEAAVKHQGVDLTFVATHLEVKEFGPLQSAQAAQLLARFGGKEPVVLVGDMNSDPGDPAYLVSGAPGPIPTPYRLLSTRFGDAASGVGDTCCFPANLRPPGSLFERVDLVLVRGAIRPVSAGRVGTLPLAALGDRWPSDHAGVVATVRLGNPKFAGPDDDEDDDHDDQGRRDDDGAHDRDGHGRGHEGRDHRGGPDRPHGKGSR